MTGTPTLDALIAVLGQARVLPVLTIDSTETAIAVRDGLIDAGLPAVEVTLRTPVSINAIRALAERSELLVGAGTVLTVDDAARAVDAGAAYLVSPGLPERVITWCANRGITVVPGVATPTEAMRAIERGMTVVKLFPASVIGGPAWLKAVGAPLPQLRFVATGGVTDATLPDYLAQPNLLAAGGSWFLPRAPWTATTVADAVRAVRARVHAIGGGQA